MGINGGLHLQDHRVPYQAKNAAADVSGLSGLSGVTPVAAEDTTDLFFPFSCSTNLANDVMDHLRRVKPGMAAWSVCAYIHRQTFGKAGAQRRRGESEPGRWCAFDLARWAAELDLPKSNLLRIRNDLATCHIILFEPSGTRRGQGRIGWNLAFDQWQRYSHHGGRRPGAGAPHGNQNARKTTPRPDAEVEEVEHAPDSSDAAESISVITPINQHEHENNHGNNENNHHDNDESISVITKTISVSTNSISVITPSTAEAGREAGAGHLQEVVRSEEEETSPNGDARALSAPRAASAVAPKKRTPREPRPDGEEMRYVRQLLEDIQREIGTKNALPKEGRERQAAHWFYRNGPNGAPALREQVVLCYRLTKIRWRGSYLSLMDLEDCWVEFCALGTDAYRAEMERRRAWQRKPPSAAARASPLATTAVYTAGPTPVRDPFAAT